MNCLGSNMNTEEMRLHERAPKDIVFQGNFEEVCHI